MTSRFQLAHQPIPPSWCKSVGFTRLAFNDDFVNTSTIDMANTGVDGFKWYLKHAWPNEAGVTGSAGDPWRTFIDQSANNLSIVGSALHCTFAPADSGIAVISAAYSASDPRGYVGNVFGPGGGFECRMKWSGASFGSQSFYLFPVEFFVGTAPKFLELDVMETTGSTTVHTGMLPWDLSVVSPNNPEGQGPFVNVSGQDGSSYHTFGLRWLTEAQNSGTGEIKFYIDDVEQTTTGIPYNYTSSASDIGKHTDPLHYVLILKGIADYDFVRVWEP